MKIGPGEAGSKRYQTRRWKDLVVAEQASVGCERVSNNCAGYTLGQREEGSSTESSADEPCEGTLCHRAANCLRPTNKEIVLP